MISRFASCLLLSATCVLSPYEAIAQSCVRFDLDSAALAFGRISLGDDRSRIPLEAIKSSQCFEQPDKNFFDCEYTDKDGVRYLVYEHQIISKDLTKDTAKDISLPAGIEFGEPIGAVLRKLASQFEDRLEWKALAGKSKDGFDLLAVPCLVDEDKREWLFQLTFDVAGKLVGISTFFPPS